MALETPSLTSLDLLQAPNVLLPETTALAVVILIGYLCGRRAWNKKRAQLDAKHEFEIERTTDIARQLEETTNALRHELNFHMNHFARFKRRLSEACENGDIETWKAIIADANQILAPTLQFTRTLSSAYSSIRQHYNILESFAQDLSDQKRASKCVPPPLDSVEELVRLARRGGRSFSLAVIGLDDSRANLSKDESGAHDPSLSAVRLLIESFKLDSYFLVSYANEDFALVMPDTWLSDACEVGELVRRIVAQRLSITVSCGIAEYEAGDDSMSLLMRARAALYSAKAGGRNRQFFHTGQGLVECSSTDTSQASEPPPLEGHNTAHSNDTRETQLAGVGIETDASGVTPRDETCLAITAT